MLACDQDPHLVRPTDSLSHLSRVPEILIEWQDLSAVVSSFLQLQLWISSSHDQLLVPPYVHYLGPGTWSDTLLSGLPDLGIFIS